MTIYCNSNLFACYAENMKENNLKEHLCQDLLENLAIEADHQRLMNISD